MKTITAGLTLLMVLMTTGAAAQPVPSFGDGWTLERLAAWAGCGDVHIEVVAGQRPNAFFFPPGGLDPERPAIAVTEALVAMPGPQILIVMLHELHHCRQWREGRLFSGDRMATELEADIEASNMACQLGHDGPKYEEDFWLLSGVNLDAPSLSHGTARERIDAVRRYATACRWLIEAPYMAFWGWM